MAARREALRADVDAAREAHEEGRRRMCAATEARREGVKDALQKRLSQRKLAKENSVKENAAE